MSITSRFLAYRAANPQVEERLLRITRELVARGHRRLSIKMCWEWVRLEQMRVQTAEPYRLSNDYTSRYARVLMRENPELAGVFDLRPIHEGEQLGRCLDVLVSDTLDVTDFREAEIEDEYTPYLKAFTPWQVQA